MNDENAKKVFDHAKAGVSDKIALVAELEHIQRHALRSAVVAQGTDDEMFYLVLARQAKQLRRDYMNKHFSEIDNKLWCLCKSTACLRQLAYETWAEDAEMLKEIDQIVDDVWGKALDKDLSDCEVCKDDRSTHNTQ